MALLLPAPFLAANVARPPSDLAISEPEKMISNKQKGRGVYCFPGLHGRGHLQEQTLWEHVSEMPSSGGEWTER
jgi:hypothetical protein